jgi:HD superfamily phosphodiesterase
MIDGSRVRRWAQRGLVFASFSLAWAALNGLAGFFEFLPGVSFFFPAAALTAVGAAALGPWAALAVWVGNFFFPWGAATGPWRTGLFGLSEVAFCLLVVVALRQAERRSRFKLSHVVLSGLVLGTLVSATLGAVLLQLFPAPAPPGVEARPLLGFVSWWLSDLAAAGSLGLAGMVLLRPQALLLAEELAAFRRWQARRGSWAQLLGLALGAGALVGALAFLGGGKPHWFVLFFLPALAVAAFRGGTGAALLANGLVAACYLVLVVSFDRSRVQAVTGELVTAYGNLFLFTAMAWLLGSQAAANRQLLAQVRRQSQALEEAVDQIATLLAQALESKERWSRGHAQRVAALAVRVGESLGLAPEELKVLRRAALLHDVGKVGVAEAVLNQPTELPQDARELLRKQLAQNLAALRRVELLEEVMAVVEAVGERWDGSTTGEFAGRLGLAGERIPLAARIVAAVRAYDAMTHPKPWRPARTREEAVAELWRCSGTQFDPKVVQVLTELLRERWDQEAERLAG